VRVYRGEWEAAKRSEAMEHPMAAQVQYDEYRRQAAWINDNDWQFEKAEKRYRVRTAMAKALIGLANLLTPTEKQETLTA
jgi:hypothetical protein